MTHVMNQVNTTVMISPAITTVMTARSAGRDPRQPKPPSLAAQRFRHLMSQLVDERGGPDKHGAIAQAGRKVGLNQSHASMIFHGERNANAATIERALEVWPDLDPRFFYDKSLDSPSYHDFVGKPQAGEIRRVGSAASVVGVLAGMNATPLEMRMLDQIPQHVRTAGDLAAALIALRAAVAAGETEDDAIDAAASAALNSSAAQTARELGGHRSETPRPRPAHVPHKRADS